VVAGGLCTDFVHDEGDEYVSKAILRYMQKQQQLDTGSNRHRPNARSHWQKQDLGIEKKQTSVLPFTHFGNALLCTRAYVRVTRRVRHMQHRSLSSAQKSFVTGQQQLDTSQQKHHQGIDKKPN
jgi:hypothetical protein